MNPPAELFGESQDLVDGPTPSVSSAALVPPVPAGLLGELALLSSLDGHFKASAVAHGAGKIFRMAGLDSHPMVISFVPVSKSGFTQAIDP